MKHQIGLALAGTLLLVLALLIGLEIPAAVNAIEARAKLQQASLQESLTLLARQGDSRLLQQYIDQLPGDALEAIAIANSRGEIVAASDPTWINVFLPTPCRLPDAPRSAAPVAEWPLLSPDSERIIGRACWRYSAAQAMPHPLALPGLSELSRPVADLLVVGLALLLGALLLVLLAAWTARLAILERLDRFKHAFERISQGDFDVRLPAGTHRALASFGRALDRMLKEVSHSTEALRRSEERFNLAVQGSNDAIWDWNVETDRLYLSPRVQDMIGYDERELPFLLSGWKRLIHADDRERFGRDMQSHLSDRRPFRCEFRVRTRDAQWRWLLARGEAVRNRRGQPLRMVGSFSDITDTKLAEEALFAEKERAEVTLQSIADAVMTTDVHGRITSLNASAEQLTGWDRALAYQLPLGEVLRLIDPGTEEPLEDLARTALERGRPLEPTASAVLVDKESQRHYVDHSAAPIRDRHGITIGAVVICHNVSERHRLTQSLYEEKERAEVTLQSIADGVITTDSEGRIESINARACALTGWRVGDARGRLLGEVFQVLDERTRQSAPAPLERVLKQGRTLESTEHGLLIARDHKEYLIDQSFAPIRDRSGRISGLVLVFHDTTERRKLIRKLSYQATHDALTKLINRYEFERRLKRALQSASDGRQHAVCYLDLDQFKLVNDTCGHEAGDELLRQLAALLLVEVREKDTLARLGGDEFGLLLEECNLDEALVIAREIRQAISEFRFIWKSTTFSLGVSIGVVALNSESGPPLEVMRAADQACYMAKHKGRNHIQVYQENDEESSHWLGQMQWVNHLTRALDDGSLMLYAQPIVPLKPDDGHYRHYELLVRMRDESGKIISPGAFLPAAERYGLITTVDRWVVTHAVQSLAEAVRDSRRLGDSAFDTFSINLSGATLAEEDFLVFVKGILAEYRLPPDMICFEITETVAVANFSQASRFVNELKALGCRFALDDFGSGFATFGYLKNLPVDYLKIDGSFVRNIHESELDMAMVSSINHIGHIIGIKTIAEFVETEVTLQHLHRLGVDYAQGHYFGKPQPLEDTIGRRVRLAAQS